ncbi:sterol-binding-like protein [Cantharellus anzutake]|uniref:sterol-binding-like protein n=1 Tax=Cantharellus anzutake TaxID=1750568 RepID=UPI001903328E|nr:sterol-binding-like protein [Cantharellus anzutake]KAF8340527.1 sterol-binding-like protein [Cantharellus anzutake]
MPDIREPGYKIGELLASVQEVFASDEKAKNDQIKRVNGIFQLRASRDGKEAIWTVDLKKEGKVSKGEAGKADVIISTSDENFILISQGKLSGQKAFMTGKLKAKGNIMLATKIESVLSAAKGKAKL